ncbi:MAG: Stk1 family PASTA domain-containing Ser/Thr kinase [Clostridiales Family XIII bacterium]|nr:Stk1 family PASTA domain-containing Ser/Thr kinase [Clostridiales Family XIII bacterium]
MSKILAGRYEILERIGDGGMAVVYRARDKLLNRSVAIKVLRPEYVTDANFVESFRKESRAAASLTHPNIVSIFDVGKDGNIYYIVMELVEGRPLSDIIREEGPLDYRIVLKISEQIASALSVAHKNNIIHRDVKPHNILITQDGHAKITDFGIARAVTDGTTVNDNTVKGTVHYFSPEQGRGMYMDERSDIYSLGIVMFEMLTGQVPFDADNAVAVAVMHMNDRMTPPSRLVPGVPPALEQIIMKATEKHQVNRFKNADEMLEALRNVDRLTGGFVNPAIAGAVRSPAMDDPNVYADENGAADSYDNGQYADDPDNGYGDNYNDDYNGDAYGEDGDAFDADAMGYDAAGAAAAGAEASDLYYDEYDEDDEDDRRVRNPKNGKKPRRKDENKKYKVIAVLIAIVAAAVLAYFIVYPLITDMMEKKDAPLAVEEVLGMNAEEASAKLEAQGYSVEIGEETFSDDYSPGYVAAQEPAANTELPAGETVTLHVSKGPEEVAEEEADEEEAPAAEEDNTSEVPDVVGKSRASAQYTIEAAGFFVGKITLEDSDKPVDQVIAQSPAKGKKAERGSKIDITVSQGEKAVEVKVPNLIGLTEKKASAALKKVNLVLGTVNHDYSDEYKKGAVMWQQYKKGKKLSEGQTVDIMISNGPEDKTSTVPIDIDFKSAPAPTFTLSVVLVLQDGTEKPIINEESREQASGGESVNVRGKGPGAKVEIYFDGELVRTVKVDFNTATTSG